MSNSPAQCIIDTNVPITANKSRKPAEIPESEIYCVLACIEAINQVVSKGGLVLDTGDEIFSEYRKNLSLSGEPGVGDVFLKWVNDNQWQFPDCDRVKITKRNGSYIEFPDNASLTVVHAKDKKFIAVANAHPAKPPILEATDSKWWGWKENLAEAGITVIFLCPKFIEEKYRKKMGISR